jgi:hypothetical protein
MTLKSDPGPGSPESALTPWIRIRIWIRTEIKISIRIRIETSEDPQHWNENYANSCARRLMSEPFIEFSYIVFMQLRYCTRLDIFNKPLIRLLAFLIRPIINPPPSSHLQLFFIYHRYFLYFIDCPIVTFFCLLSLRFALHHVGFVCLILQISLILIGASHIMGSSQNSPYM